MVESDGAEANATAVAAGEAELGLVQSDTMTAPGLQAIAAVFPEVLHLVARDASGIATPADHGGKRLALMPAGSGSNAVFARVIPTPVEPFGRERPVDNFAVSTLSY